MNILITGGSGLVGSALIKELMKSGHNIITLGRKSVEGCHHIAHDFNNELDSVNFPSSIDVIYHIAQSEYYRDFPNSAIDIFQVNTVSTLKLAEWARINGVKKFVYTSSGGIYGNNSESFEEKDTIKINNLGFYLGSKLCSEVILDSYKNYFEVFTLRLFFVYGKEQKPNMLIPRLINNVKAGDSITIQGENGIIINPIHVKDAAKALSSCLSLEKGGEFNIAGNEQLSLLELVSIIGDTLSIKPNFSNLNEEPISIIGNNSKMCEFLYMPEIAFKKGIDLMINE
jgi:nucleoside-diphosphate-sugar epimerase